MFFLGSLGLLSRVEGSGNVHKAAAEGTGEDWRVCRSRSSGLGPHIGYNHTTCRRSNHSQYSFALCVGVWWNPSMQVLRYLKVGKSYLFDSANSHIQKDRRQLSVRGLGLAPTNRLECMYEVCT